MTATEIIAALRSLPRKELPPLLVAIAGLMAETEPAATDDELIGVEAAAAMLSVSPSWLYHRRKLPFAVKVGSRKLFSRSGIQRYIRNKQGHAE